MDNIVKKEENALAKKPLEWLKVAVDTWTEAMQNMSAALIQDLDVTETAMIHTGIKKMDNDIKSFHKNVRERLGTFVVEQGKQVTEKGTLEVDLGNGMVQRAIPTNTKPEDGRTANVLRGKGLSLDSWMDKEVTWRANDSKLRHMIDSNLLTEEEYKQCFGKVAYRIGKVQPKGEGEDDE